MKRNKREGRILKSFDNANRYDAPIQAQLIRCPTCEASPGDRCRRVKVSRGVAVTMASPHPERIKAARNNQTLQRFGNETC